jgi:hypothetical protein
MNISSNYQFGNNFLNKYKKRGMQNNVYSVN